MNRTTFDNPLEEAEHHWDNIRCPMDLMVPEGKSDLVAMQDAPEIRNAPIDGNTSAMPLRTCLAMVATVALLCSLFFVLDRPQLAGNTPITRQPSTNQAEPIMHALIPESPKLSFSQFSLGPENRKITLPQSQTQTFSQLKPDSVALGKRPRNCFQFTGPSS